MVASFHTPNQPITFESQNICLIPFPQFTHTTTIFEVKMWSIFFLNFIWKITVIRLGSIDKCQSDFWEELFVAFRCVSRRFSCFAWRQQMGNAIYVNAELGFLRCDYCLDAATSYLEAEKLPMPLSASSPSSTTCCMESEQTNQLSPFN